jgi:hypothetical protein
MKSELPVRVILIDPPPGVRFGIQRRRGTGDTTKFAQERTRGDIVFNFSITVSDSRKDDAPNFLGDFVQGPAGRRFVCIGVGTHAGQKHTSWSRRIIVGLDDVTWELIRKVQAKASHRLSASIPGSGKDGTPSCATVPILGGWKIVKD